MTELVRVTASNGVRLRGAARDGATLRVLQNGERVEVLGRETWLRVRRGDQVGFVLADHVEPLENVVTPEAHGSIALPAGAAAALFSDRVNIVEFSGSTVFRGSPLRVDEEFLPDLRKVEVAAGTRGLTIWITSSLREPNKPVANAVVAPAQFSNHHVGHAIDVNLILEGRFFRSTELANFGALPSAIQSFLNEVRQSPNDLRWGNDFSKADPVHLDNGLNLRRPDVFKSKLARLWHIST